MRSKTASLLLTGVVALGTATGAQVAPRAAEPPRLVVFLVVDQMRADYVTLYGHRWTKGLRRLLDTGATFPLARYPYAYTVTCPGHATISTGSFPATHGMVGNEWYDRAAGRTVTCTDDREATSIPFGGQAGGEHHAPTRLRVPTFADELRLMSPRPPQVVTLSIKARSTIMLAGQPSPSTYAVWFEDRGSFATSTAYARTPWPVVDQFVAAHPIAADYGHVWTRAKPAADYLFDDRAEGELAPVEFPHPLVSKSGNPDEEFVTLWKRSPLSDRYLGRLGQHLAEGLKLGQTPGTDILGIGFSALDTVGHEYGPHSHEVQDVLMRLDETIGEVLDTLDTLVGRERYVVALTADHGVALIPEQDQDMAAGDRRYTSTPLRATLNTAIESLLGPGTYVTTKVGSHIYFAPGVLTRVLSTEGGREAVTRAAESFPGVARVYWADELASTVPTDDALLRASRLSYAADRAGDLMLVTELHWVPQAAGTTHGSPHGYDQHVPLVLAGAGIRPGRYLSPATPADIAPTLALLVGMTMGHADGRPLIDAIR